MTVQVKPSGRRRAINNVTTRTEDERENHFAESNSQKLEALHGVETGKYWDDYDNQGVMAPIPRRFITAKWNEKSHGTLLHVPKLLLCAPS